jgi:hypothetical protein
MRLQRLVEVIREDSEGAEEWLVLFASYKQNSAGEWHEIEGVREPITSVEVDETAEEVLLITDSDRSPLSLATLLEKLTQLKSCHSEFVVDFCETPIVLDGGTFRVDIPIVGAGRDGKNRCYLVVYALKDSN